MQVNICFPEFASTYGSPNNMRPFLNCYIFGFCGFHLSPSLTAYRQPLAEWTGAAILIAR